MVSSTRSTRSSTGRTRTTAAKPATAAGAATTTRVAATGSTKTDRTTDEKTGEKAASAPRKAARGPRKAPAEAPGRARAAKDLTRTRTRARTRAGGATTPGKAAAATAGRVRRRPSGPRVTLTGRGGVVVISAATLAGALTGQLLEVGSLPGLAFVAGCVAAAVLTRPADVLSLAVCPPAVFFVVALIAEFVDAVGGESVLRSTLLGVVGLLAAQAPWLFLGSALVIGITVPRGLLTSMNELRTRLAGVRRLSDIYDEDPVRWNEPPSAHPHGETPDGQGS